MQKVILTIDNHPNAYLLLELIKQFDFIKSVDFYPTEVIEETDVEDEIFTNELPEDTYLDDFQMTVGELQTQTLQDEQEEGMSKSEFLNAMKEWREAKEK